MLDRLNSLGRFICLEEFFVASEDQVRISSPFLRDQPFLYQQPQDLFLRQGEPCGLPNGSTDVEKVHEDVGEGSQAGLYLLVRKLYHYSVR